MGWFHPAGTAYTPSLIALDGSRYLAGVGRRGNGPFEWLTFDLQTNRSTAGSIPLPELGIHPNKTLLYGSLARDDAGNCYLVGITDNRPLALRVQIDHSTMASARSRDDVVPQITVYQAAALEPVDFGDEANRIIFGAMVRLHSASKPVDVSLLVGVLRDRGKYNAEDGVSAATLVELFRPAPLVRHLPYYVERVAEM